MEKMDWNCFDLDSSSQHGRRNAIPAEENI